MSSPASSEASAMESFGGHAESIVKAVGVVTIDVPDYLHAGAPQLSTLCIGVALLSPTFLLLSLALRSLWVRLAPTPSGVLLFATLCLMSVSMLFAMVKVVGKRQMKEQKISCDYSAVRRSKRRLGCD